MYILFELLNPATGGTAGGEKNEYSVVLRLFIRNSRVLVFMGL